MLSRSGFFCARFLAPRESQALGILPGLEHANKAEAKHEKNKEAFPDGEACLCPSAAFSREGKASIAPFVAPVVRLGGRFLLGDLGALALICWRCWWLPVGRRIDGSLSFVAFGLLTLGGCYLGMTAPALRRIKQLQRIDGVKVDSVLERDFSKMDILLKSIKSY